MKNQDSSNAPPNATKHESTDLHTPPLIDVEETSRLCGISVAMTYKLHRQGKMPKAVRIGTLLRWKRNEIMEWIDMGCPSFKMPGKKR